MIALAALLVLALGGPAPARHSRAEFVEAISTVQMGWSQAQVRELLGPPDDVWPPNDPQQYVMPGDEAWCYGTHGHHTMPTLGSVMFRNGSVNEVIGARGEPPSTKVIREAELVDSMRAMSRRRSKTLDNDPDPQRLIQVANLLMSKGQEKALAILGEYARVGFDAFPAQNWLFFLVRVMFTSSLPDGAIPVPPVGMVEPMPPKDPAKWPTYPVVTIDAVPVSLLQVALISGAPASFTDYLRDHQEEWTLRHEKLRPPDDPFPVFKKLLASREWPFPRGEKNAVWNGVPIAKDHGRALQAILNLVRTAYRPVATGQALIGLNALDYEKFHREFLALGCRWDEKRQMYVRADGSTLPEPAEETPHRIVHLPEIPGLALKFYSWREDDQMARFDCVWDETGKAPIQDGVVVVEDATSGGEIAWTPLNARDLKFGARLTKEQVFAMPPHEPVPAYNGLAYGFRSAKGQKVRFVILIGGKRYASPVYVP